MFGFFRPPPPKTGAGRPVSHPSSNPHPTCFISSPRVGQVLESRLFMPCHHLSFFSNPNGSHDKNIWKHESMNPRPSLPTLAPLAPVVALEVGHWRHSGFTCGFSWGDRPSIKLYFLLLECSFILFILSYEKLGIWRYPLPLGPKSVFQIFHKNAGIDSWIAFGGKVALAPEIIKQQEVRLWKSWKLWNPTVSMRCLYNLYNLSMFFRAATCCIISALGTAYIRCFWFGIEIRIFWGNSLFEQLHEISFPHRGRLGKSTHLPWWNPESWHELLTEIDMFFSATRCSFKNQWDDHFRCFAIGWCGPGLSPGDQLKMLLNIRFATGQGEKRNMAVELRFRGQMVSMGS